MPETIRYPALDATPERVTALAYRATVSWAFKEIDRIETNIARAMAPARPEAWYLTALRAELGHVKVFLAVLVGANSNLNHFTVSGDGWVAALRALLSAPVPGAALTSEDWRLAALACGEPDGKPCTVPDCPWCHANPTPAPSEPVQCLHHDGAGNPAHVPGCTICPYSPFNGEACAAPGTVSVVTPGSDHTSTLVCEEHLPHYIGGGWVEEVPLR